MLYFIFILKKSGIKTRVKRKGGKYVNKRNMEANKIRCSWPRKRSAASYAPKGMTWQISLSGSIPNISSLAFPSTAQLTSGLTPP